MEGNPSTNNEELEQLDSNRERARFAAKQIGGGFVQHDKRNREAAVDSFTAVDKLQFAHITDSEAREAAEYYVEALWRKDRIEDECRVDGEIVADKVAGADWSPVEEAFRERANVVGADPRYATLSTRGWVEHKAGGDYWTPLMRAQKFEIRAAIQDDAYPRKPRSGTSGFGPEPARYVVGVELHDMRRYEEGIDVMEPYFNYIFENRS